MKILFFGIITLFLGKPMQENNNSQPPLKVSIELPDTIYAGYQAIPIILKVENMTSEVLSIRNPAHWGNAFPRIKWGKKEIAIIKVKINPNVFKDIIQINGNEILRIKFDYALDKIFSLELYPSGKYDIYFIYSYDEKISIESDVFTFYRQ
jgi:hypothetical protein